MTDGTLEAPALESKQLTTSDLNTLLPQRVVTDQVSVSWGVVAELDPLSVKVDGPADDPPCECYRTMDATVDVGDRVVCLLSGTQLVLLGKVFDSDEDFEANRATSIADAVELESGSNLNLVVSPGYRTVSTDAAAAAGTNFPEPRAGLVRVYGNGDDYPLSYDEMGRNYALDPRATAWVVNGGLGWGNGRSFVGGTGTYTLVAGASDGPLLSDGTTRIPTYARKTWSAAGASGTSGLGIENSKSGVNGYPVTPLDPYFISSYVRSSYDYGDGISTGARLQVQFYDGAGALVGAEQSGPWVPLVAGVWARLQISLVVPAGAAFMQVISDLDGLSAPGTLAVSGTGLLVEKVSDLGPYYDGSYTYDISLAASWTGAANASESVLTEPSAYQPAMIWQSYWVSAPHNRLWLRAAYNGVWTAWRPGSPASFRARGSFGGTVPLAAGYNRLTNWTEDYDPAGVFDPTTGMYVTPVAGLYVINLAVAFQTASVRRFIQVETGTAAAGSASNVNRIRSEGPTTGYSSLSCTTEIALDAGVSISGVAYCASATDLRGDLAPSSFSVRLA